MRIFAMTTHQKNSIFSSRASSQPLLSLAPMQAISHLPMMRVLNQFGGPDYFITEYFRVHSDSSLDKFILKSICENNTNRPVFAQLMGEDVPSLVRTTKELLHYPIAGIDLNLGCPAPVVCRKNAGGGLLRQLTHLNLILDHLREVIPVGMFSIKTRLGYKSVSEFSELLEIFHHHHIDILTVHGRTIKERYQSPIHTECIRQAVHYMNCPVVANGNIVDISTGAATLKKTQAAGLMIGRGAIRNPWIFQQLRDYFSGKTPYTHTRSDLLSYINSLYDEIARQQKTFDEKRHIQHMKKYLVYIVQGLDQEFEHAIRRVTSAQDFLSICQHFLSNSTPVPPLPPTKSKLFCGFTTK